MWNNLSPENPIWDICEYGKKDASIIDDLSNLVTDLTTSAETLTEEHLIWDEILIFRNIQAQYKRILHCDKCLQLLQRVGVCLRKMVLLKLSQIYIDLGEKFLTELKKGCGGSYFLPSQQQLDYVLLRTQTAAKLICECLHFSREAFCYLIQKLKIGHLIINLMMATSVTARLNIVLKGLLLQVFNIYKRLYKWRFKLKLGGYEWSQKLDLPEDLESWINLKESEHLKPKQLPKEKLDFLTSIFNENNQRDSPPETDDDDVIPVECCDSTTDAAESEKECIMVEDDNEEETFDEGAPVERSEFEVESVAESEPFENDDSVIPKSQDQQNKLSKAQRKLLKKIKSVQSMKELKAIWNNLDITCKDLLPRGITPVNMRLVDKVFLQLKRALSVLKKSDAPSNEKENQSKLLLQMAGLKFAKILKIVPNKKEFRRNNSGLQPVKTFKELRELYRTIYEKLQSDQDYNRCSKLKKTFRNRKADIKLLIKNGERSSAKQLVHSTSKLFLIKFLS